MGVGLGDDADRRPAGVAQDQTLDVVGTERQVQELVVGHRGAQRGGVVAELADLGRGLVDEQQHAVDQPDRARGERAVVPLGERPAQDRVVGRDPMTGELDLDAGGVASTDLEPVDRRERLVEAEEHGEARGACSGRGHRRDLVGGTDAVAADGPDGVLHADERGVDGLEVRAAEPGVAGVQGGLDLLRGGRHLGDLRGDAADRSRVRSEREDARNAPEVAVDALEQVGGSGQLLGPGRRDVGEQPVGNHEPRQDLVDVDRLTRRPTTHYGDDAAHRTHPLLLGNGPQAVAASAGTLTAPGMRKAYRGGSRTRPAATGSTGGWISLLPDGWLRRLRGPRRPLRAVRRPGPPGRRWPPRP